LAVQPFGSGRVVEFRFGRIVKRTIDLDDQSTFVVHEISDEAADGRLASNVELQLSQIGPEELFREGLLATEMTSACDRAAAMPRLGGQGITPIPNPSPIKGEGSLIAPFDQASARSRST